MKPCTRGEIVKCPACGNLPDGCKHPAEDYFAPPAKPKSFEQIECGNCYAIIDCEVSVCGNYFLFSVGDEMKNVPLAMAGMFGCWI